VCAGASRRPQTCVGVIEAGSVPRRCRAMAAVVSAGERTEVQRSLARGVEPLERAWRSAHPGIPPPRPRLHLTAEGRFGNRRGRAAVEAPQPARPRSRRRGACWDPTGGAALAGLATGRRGCQGDPGAKADSSAGQPEHRRQPDSSPAMRATAFGDRRARGRHEAMDPVRHAGGSSDGTSRAAGCRN
jgi:hypothetical protein